MAIWDDVIASVGGRVDRQVRVWVTAGGRESDLIVLQDLGTRWAKLFGHGPIGFADPPDGCEVIDGGSETIRNLFKDRQVLSVGDMEMELIQAYQAVFCVAGGGKCAFVDWAAWTDLHITLANSRGGLHRIWGIGGELSGGSNFKELYQYLVFRGLGLPADPHFDIMLQALDRGYYPIGRRGDQCLVLRVPAQSLVPDIPERPRRRTDATAPVIDLDLVGNATAGALYFRNRIHDGDPLPKRLLDQMVLDKRFVRQRQVRYRANILGQDCLVTDDAEWAIRLGRSGVGAARIQVMREPGGDLDVWQVVGEPSEAERQVLAELCTYAGARLTADLPYHEEGRWGAEDGPAAPKAADWDAERCVLRRGRPRRHTGLIPLVDQYPGRPVSAKSP